MCVRPLGNGVTSALEGEVAEEGGRRTDLVRRFVDADEAANHVAVLERLQSRALPFVTTIADFVDGLHLETTIDALPAIGLAPAPAAWEEAVDTLATLHECPLREGLRGGTTPQEALPPAPPPLLRVGFTAEEREAAAPSFVVANDALAGTPFDFVHGHATVECVVFGREGPVLVDWSNAGWGPQLFDVAALFATRGLPPAERRRLAERYGQRRAVPAAGDLVDLATVVWGVDELLRLPPRQAAACGDEAATERLVVAARRVERALRDAAGHHPAATAIRDALWPP